MRARTVVVAVIAGVMALGLPVGCAPTGNADQKAVSISAITAENVYDLLTVEEVRGVASEFVSEAEFFDYKDMAESVNPAQVTNMDEWFGLSFHTGDRTRILTFTVIDFDTAESARAHLERVTRESGIGPLDTGVGQIDFGGQLDEAGLTAVFGFVKGEVLVQLLSTTQAQGQGTLVDLDGLIDLGRLVDARLAG